METSYGTNSLKYSRCCPLSIKRFSCLVKGPIITGPKKGILFVPQKSKLELDRDRYPKTTTLFI